jgi:hypothetical protein
MQRAFRIVLLLGLGFPLARVLLLLARIDHLTTIHTWRKAGCIAIAVTVAFASAALVARLVATPDPSSDSNRIGGQEQPQSAQVAAGALGVGVIVLWACMGMLGAVAQHVPGRPEVLSATVFAVGPSTAVGRGTCRQYVVFTEDRAGAKTSICVRTRYGPSLSTAELEPGTAVRIYVTSTQWGDVVTSIEPISRSDNS